MLPVLWKHQEQALEKSKGKDRFLYFCDVGTGKTGIVINKLRQIYRANKALLPTLIVCPIAVMKQLSREFVVFGGDYYKDKITIINQSNKKLKVEALKKSREIVIINYESCILDPIYKILADKKFKAVVFDEVHLLKKPTAKSLKKINNIIYTTKYRFGLSGTPILNNIGDVWSIFDVVCGCGAVFSENYYSFRATYMYDQVDAFRHKLSPEKKNMKKYVPRVGAIEAIKKKIEPYVFTVKKRDCLDLPPLVSKTVEVVETKEIQEAYNNMEREYIHYLTNGEAVVATTALTKVLRMQQILAGVLSTPEKEFIVVPERLKVLKDTIENIDYLGNKIIIWTVFTPSYRYISDMLKSLNIEHRMYTGVEGIKEKDTNIDDFVNDDNVRVLVANPSAGGRGLNLTIASYMIYYQRSYSLEQRYQSIGRIERGGSVHDKLTMIDIVASNTIDDVILEALDKKQNVLDKLTNFRR